MAKKKITKEELKKLLSYRKRLITLKRKSFYSVSKDAAREYDEFRPCDRCKFLCKDCQNNCGVLMKFLHKAGKSGAQASFGLGGRIVSESEFLDTSSVNLGVSEEVDAAISKEMNGAEDFLIEHGEIALNEIESQFYAED